MERRNRVVDVLRSLDADWAVVCLPETVLYATGHIVPIETGPSPFSGGPTLAFVGRDGAAGLVCSNTELRVISSDINVESYSGFANAVTDQQKNYMLAIETLIRKLGVNGTLAIEDGFLPKRVADMIAGRFVSIDRPLALTRAIKTEGEVAIMRHVANITSAGQEHARRASRTGSSEVEVLGEIRFHMEDLAGGRCALTGEYIGGKERTAKLGLAPNNRKLVAGDPVICDLAPRINGYWGDSCSSFTVGGGGSPAYQKMFDTAKLTLDLAISEIRPGLKVSELDRTLRDFMQKSGFSYPHHSGHGIGTSVHEYPRLVPDEHALLEENMIIMVEPGTYIDGIGGVRTEHMIRVSRTGCEVLTDFEIKAQLG